MLRKQRIANQWRIQAFRYRWGWRGGGGGRSSSPWDKGGLSFGLKIRGAGPLGLLPWTSHCKPVLQLQPLPHRMSEILRRNRLSEGQMSIQDHNFSPLRLDLLGWDNEHWVLGISCKNVAQRYTVPTPGQNKLVPIPVTRCLQFYLRFGAIIARTKTKKGKTRSRDIRLRRECECLITSVKSKQMNMTVIHFQS